MAWSALIGQERVVDMLRRTLLRKRVPHAYLFHGPKGTGPVPAALELARALQCTEQTEEACDACAACQKTRRMVHPDVHVFFPYPKGTSDDDVAQRIKRLGESPYAPVDYVRRPSLDDPEKTSNKQVMYHIDRMKEEVVRPMTFHPGEGAYKIALLTDAEYMNASAANAFLKVLEEPPAQTVFILTSSRVDQMLPTIVSRCQKVRFDPLSPDAIAQALHDRENMEPEEASMLARMADGSYSRALQLTESTYLRESRTLVLNYLRAAYTQKVGPLNERIDAIASLGRERTKSVLRLMIRWIRDLMLYRTLGDDAPLVNVDQTEAVANFCNRLPKADLQAMVARVEEALHLIGRNVRTRLVLMTLALQLRTAMHGHESTPVYQPLPEQALTATLHTPS
ncbi:MAG: DNA polymerase III subunit delta' [Longimonas sp.]|uniref:DNA polymerase III subunit delta' n=1 Tax=Longimonas sp. TaxID=2039626 RepID=UPI003977029D